MPTFYFSYTLKPRLKCVKKFINDFFRNFIPLFNYGFFRKFENDYPSASVTFYSRSPQISKSTGFKSGLFRGEWWGSRNRSFFFQHFKGDISFGALARSCTNNYSLYFTSLFISEIIFSISILQWCFAFTFVFGSTIQKFYQLPISPQKPLLALEKL